MLANKRKNIAKNNARVKKQKLNKKKTQQKKRALQEKIKRIQREKTKRIQQEAAVQIQKVVRGYLARQYYEELLCTTLIKDKEYRNTETLIGDPIEDIDKCFIFINQSYVLDMREIIKYETKKNPYTNIPFDTFSDKLIKKIIYKLNEEGISLVINNDIPLESEITALTTTVFNLLSRNDTYPDIMTFNDYDIEQLYVYFKYIVSFDLIDKAITYAETRRIYNFYNNYNHLKLRYYILITLKKIITIDDEHSDTRSIIITETIRDDIIDIYRYGENPEVYDNPVYNSPVFGPIIPPLNLSQLPPPAILNIHNTGLPALIPLDDDDDSGSY